MAERDSGPAIALALEQPGVAVHAAKIPFLIIFYEWHLHCSVAAYRL
jgi:hypothetical protein